MKPPPAGTADVTEPFAATQPAGRPQNHPQQFSTDQSLTGPVPSQIASTFAVAPDQQSDSEMDTDLASDTESLPCITGHVEEGKLSDIEQDLSLTDNDQALCEEQNYRETMQGIRSFMGWSHIPDVDSALSSSEDNLFAAPKQQPSGKISVNLPTDDWLCHKMDRLNLTLTQGYPSKSAEAGGLLRDQFVKPKSQVKWYGLHPSQDRPARSVSFWHSETARLNSTYSRIARSSGLTLPAPASRAISQRKLPGKLLIYVTKQLV